MTTALTKSTKQEIATPTTVKGWLQSEQFKQQVSLVASKYITPERFVRVALTALLKTPKLQHCSPESVLKSCLGCAQMGVEPDGRNAHLIPYGAECSLQMDWKGYVAIAKRNGINVTPKVVCANDKFHVEEDDGTGRTKVVHQVDYTKDRGEMVAVYSRAVETDYVDYEIMTRAEVEYVRDTFSKAKDADAWKKSFPEMAKKTVIKRHSKRWNLDVDLEEESAMAAAQVQTAPVIDVPPALPEFNPAPVAVEAPPKESPKPAKKKEAKVEAPAPEPTPATPLGDALNALEAALLKRGLHGGQVVNFYNNLGNGIRAADAPEVAEINGMPETVQAALAKALNADNVKIIEALKVLPPV